MKKVITLFSFILLAVIVKAQNPVTWSFTAIKLEDKKYEIRMTATIQSGWHVFSQTQPEDAIAIPTSFSLNSNPLLTLDGKIREVGKMEKFRDEKLDISANQYSGTVSFVQTVKLKATAKTNITGNVEFQTCNDEKCLPPKTINFSVPIN
jgi:thiol:disulfide interchange protein DsbD